MDLIAKSELIEKSRTLQLFWEMEGVFQNRDPLVIEEFLRMHKEIENKSSHE
jgi:hypothetical protein